MPTTSYSFNRGEETFDVEIEYTLTPYAPGLINTMAVWHDGASFELTAAEQNAVDEFIYDLRDRAE